MALKDIFTAGPKSAGQRRLTADERRELSGIGSAAHWIHRKVSAALGISEPQEQPAVNREVSVDPERRILRNAFTVTAEPVDLTDGQVGISLLYNAALGQPSHEDVLAFCAMKYPGMAVVDGSDNLNGVMRLILAATDGETVSDTGTGTDANSRGPAIGELEEGTGKIAQAGSGAGGPSSGAGAGGEGASSAAGYLGTDHPDQTTSEGNERHKYKKSKHAQAAPPPEAAPPAGAPPAEPPAADDPLMAGGPPADPSMEEDQAAADSMSLQDAVQGLEAITKALVEKVQSGETMIGGQELEPVAEAPEQGAPLNRQTFSAEPITGVKKEAAEPLPKVPCPTCGATGKDRFGKTCPTCKGWKTLLAPSSKPSMAREVGPAGEPALAPDKPSRPLPDVDKRLPGERLEPGARSIQEWVKQRQQEMLGNPAPSQAETEGWKSRPELKPEVAQSYEQEKALADEELATRPEPRNVVEWVKKRRDEMVGADPVELKREQLKQKMTPDQQKALEQRLLKKETEEERKLREYNEQLKSGLVPEDDTPVVPVDPNKKKTQKQYEKELAEENRRKQMEAMNPAQLRDFLMAERKQKALEQAKAKEEKTEKAIGKNPALSRGVGETGLPEELGGGIIQDKRSELAATLESLAVEKYTGSGRASPGSKETQTELANIHTGEPLISLLPPPLRAKVMDPSAPKTPGQHFAWGELSPEELSQAFELMAPLSSTFRKRLKSGPKPADRLKIKELQDAHAVAGAELQDLREQRERAVQEVQSMEVDSEGAPIPPEVKQLKLERLNKKTPREVELERELEELEAEANALMPKEKEDIDTALSPEDLTKVTSLKEERKKLDEKLKQVRLQKPRNPAEAEKLKGIEDKIQSAIKRNINTLHSIRSPAGGSESPAQMGSLYRAYNELARKKFDLLHEIRALSDKTPEEKNLYNKRKVIEDKIKANADAMKALRAKADAKAISPDDYKAQYLELDTEKSDLNFALQQAAPPRKTQLPGEKPEIDVGGRIEKLMTELQGVEVKLRELKKKLKPTKKDVHDEAEQRLLTKQRLEPGAKPVVKQTPDGLKVVHEVPERKEPVENLMVTPEERARLENTVQDVPEAAPAEEPYKPIIRSKPPESDAPPTAPLKPTGPYVPYRDVDTSSLPSGEAVVEKKPAPLPGAPDQPFAGRNKLIEQFRKFFPKKGVDENAKEYWEGYLKGYGHEMVEGCCEEHDKQLSDRKQAMREIAAELNRSVTDYEVDAVCGSLHCWREPTGEFLLHAQLAPGAKPSIPQMVDMLMEMSNADSAMSRVLDRLTLKYLLKTSDRLNTMSPEEQKAILMRAARTDGRVNNSLLNLYNKATGVVQQAPTPQAPPPAPAQTGETMKTAEKMKTPKPAGSQGDSIKMKDLKDVAAKEQIPIQRGLKFSYEKPALKGKYTFLDVAWEPKDAKGLGYDALKQQIISFIKGLESRKEFKDFGYLGKVHLENLDESAGLATVYFRSQSGADAPLKVDDKK